MRLFAVLAGHAELAAVDRDAYLHHDIPESQRRPVYLRLTRFLRRSPTPDRVRGRPRPEGAMVMARSPPAPSGWYRWRRRAVRPPRGWWSRARVPAPPQGRGRRPTASDRRPPHAAEWSAHRRRGRPRADVRPPPPAHQVRAQDVWWPRRWRLARSFPQFPLFWPIPPGFVSLMAAKILWIGKRLERKSYVAWRLAVNV